MRLLLSFFFICCAVSCMKYGSEGSSSLGNTRDDYYDGLAKVVRVDHNCPDTPVLMEFVGGSWITSFKYSDDFTDDNEFWSYAVPDTLKAVGQYLWVYYQPDRNYRLKKCSNKVLPNQIIFQNIRPFWDWPLIEVLEVNSGCGGMTLVKLDRYFIDYYGADRVWILNLPDSLKIVGKKFNCYMRHASISEIIKCNHQIPLQQAMVTNIYP